MPALPSIPPIVDTAWLTAHYPDRGTDPRLVLADVRWYPDGRDPREAYLEGHLSGAVHVDLDSRLAGPPSAAEGRHPLPEPALFAQSMGEVGIGDASTVVAYDDAGGIFAARLVWMLRALGREAALIDGGYHSAEVRCWAGGLSTEPVSPLLQSFTPAAWPPELLADLADITPGQRSDSLRIFDARPAPRFRGEGPDLDPRSGHVPGARSLPCREQVELDGQLAPIPSLRLRFAEVGVTADTVAAGEVIAMCGSGVTACHGLLAAEHAGLGRARLFPGSWSQYAATDLPLAVGPEPSQSPHPG